ncbi:MAG TPA: 50S ribosomal protein L10 [Ktedonobacteraceae bacterium]|nr:50S ribosomal protein L10 [Ktedonobacteraceae bacterium]
MPTQAKAETIEQLAEKLKRATVAILVQTQGLKVKDMNDLRGKMRAAKVDFQVAKNTLLRIATERNHMTDLDTSIFNGQTAIALGYDDEITAAKAVADYVRTSKVVVLKSGILGGRTLSAQQVEDLAKMPGGKLYAKAQLVGVVQGPLATTYSLLTAPLRDLCYVIQARAEQLQQRSAETTATAEPAETTETAVVETTAE